MMKQNNKIAFLIIGWNFLPIIIFRLIYGSTNGEENLIYIILFLYFILGVFLNIPLYNSIKNNKKSSILYLPFYVFSFFSIASLFVIIINHIINFYSFKALFIDVSNGVFYNIIYAVINYCIIKYYSKKINNI